MTNLLGSSKILDNASMRARTSAAVRQTAATKTSEAGAVGQLARAALLNPEFVIPAFLTRISVNVAVAEAACTDCGYAGVADGDLLYVVAAAWAEVAEVEYPETPTEETP